MQRSRRRKSASTAEKLLRPSEKISARNSAPVNFTPLSLSVGTLLSGAQHAAPLQAHGTQDARRAGCARFVLSSRIENHERAGESADFRADVLHPGGTGCEVCAEAREVRGRKNARYRRSDEDGGHAESRGAGGAGDCR